MAAGLQVGLHMATGARLGEVVYSVEEAVPSTRQQGAQAGSRFPWARVPAASRAQR